ncbi:hypothetical protein B0H11DRAFT_761188 [Mycena galericulata]|nr:hypothetical protein B0H11DRAFT_761188 [Mycena galericulata]
MSSPDTPSPILVVNVAEVVGPVFIGNILNWMFMGTLIMQLYTYYQNFPTDRTFIKILVYGLFLVDVAQTVILTHHGWFFIVDSWDKASNFNIVPWSSTMIPILCGLVAAIVQIFYSWRIWLLSTNPFLRGMAILITLVALTQGLSAMITGFISLKNPTQQDLIRLHPGFSVWLAGSLAADIMITACMTWILVRAKTRTFWASSETMITMLINRVVQSGAVTALSAGVDLALFVGVSDTNFHFVPAYILGKLYTNSLFLTLNLRRPTNRISESESLPMSADLSGDIRNGIHVSRSTHVETSNPAVAAIWTQKSNQTDSKRQPLQVDSNSHEHHLKMLDIDKAV